jgi:YbbR domain-containing protein
MEKSKQINLKILALVSAIILWFIVITVENNVIKYPNAIRIQAQNIAESLTLKDSLPVANVFLKMDREQFKEISENDIEVYIDLGDKRQGQHTVQVEALVNGSRSKILKVDPAQIQIELTEMFMKEVKVETEITGTPAEEYKVSSASVKPERIKLEGPKILLDKIDVLKALHHLKGDEKADIVVIVIPELAGIDSQETIKISPADVEITIKIEKEIIEKEVEIQPKFIRESDRSIYEKQIEITPAKVKIKGKKEVIEKITSILTSPLEVSALIRSRQINPKLELPDGVTQVELGQQITVTLK